MRHRQVSVVVTVIVAVVAFILLQRHRTVVSVSVKYTLILFQAEVSLVQRLVLGLRAPAGDLGGVGGSNEEGSEGGGDGGRLHCVGFVCGWECE